jgi:hypothetical protein
MHRLSALLLSFMLVLMLGLGSVAHATEGVTCMIPQRSAPSIIATATLTKCRRTPTRRILTIMVVATAIMSACRSRPIQPDQPAAFV